MATPIYDKLLEVQVMLSNSLADAKKADLGNVLAGKRLRKTTMEVGDLLKDVRQTVIEVRKEAAKYKSA